MSELQRFLPEDQDLLVGIFYRTGYWISHVDDTDMGDESERAEHKQMMAILTRISKTSETFPVIRELAEEALRQTGNWIRWEMKDSDIEDDLLRAAKVMKAQSSPAEYKSFSNALMAIVTSVARAFREDPENKPEDDGYFSWISGKVNELALALQDSGARKDLNISPAEDNAINTLFSILKDA